MILNEYKNVINNDFVDFLRYIMLKLKREKSGGAFSEKKKYYVK